MAALVAVSSMDVLWVARPVAAESVTAEQLEALAEQARRDVRALDRLRQVDTVGGRRVDLGRALAGAEGEVLEARLRALAGGAGGGGGGQLAPSPAAARAEARRILAQRRFRPARTPRPLRGVLRRLGGWLRPVVEPLGRLWDDVSGNVLGRLLVVIAVIGIAALTSIRLVRRRTAAGVAPRARSRRRREEDPDELEREAERAERDGDFDLAFRLRFRAGLLRLDRAGVVPWRPSLTTGQLTRSVRSPTFERLASAFDEIVYGGRRAGPADLAVARAEWPTVLGEARPPEPGDTSDARAPLGATGSARVPR